VCSLNNALTEEELIQVGLAALELPAEADTTDEDEALKIIASRCFDILEQKHHIENVSLSECFI